MEICAETDIESMSNESVLINANGVQFAHIGDYSSPRAFHVFFLLSDLRRAKMLSAQCEFWTAAVGCACGARARGKHRHDKLSFQKFVVDIFFCIFLFEKD